MTARPFLFIAGLAVALLAACHRTEPATTSEPPSPKITADTVTFPAGAPQLASLTVAPAERRTLALSHLTGRLALNEDATVRIFSPVMGQVRRTLADVGDRIAADAPLAEIDSPDFAQARADARSAAANLEVAEKALARARDLAVHGAAAQKDVEAATAAERSARAERDRAATRLELYHGSEESGRYLLRTPLAGTVIEKNVNPGQEVRNDQMLAGTNLAAPLFVVSDPGTLWLQLDAAETDLAEIHPGDRLNIRSRAYPDRTFTGSILNVGLTLDPQSRTARVRGVVENPDHLLKAEMYVDVDVVQDASKLTGAAIEVPARSVFMVDGTSYLFVETAPGTFVRRAVQVDSERDGRIPVRAGVAAGERIVVEGALLLEAELSPN